VNASASASAAGTILEFNDLMAIPLFPEEQLLSLAPGPTTNAVRGRMPDLKICLVSRLEMFPLLIIELDPENFHCLAHRECPVLSTGDTSEVRGGERKMFDFSQLGGLVTSLALWFALMPTLVFVLVAGLLLFFLWRFVRAHERMASAIDRMADRPIVQRPDDPA
jgi:hypothetical protein